MNYPCRTRSRGFTLIEMLVVVALVAILAMLAIPNMLNAHVRSKVARTKADLRTLSLGVDLYRADHDSFPDHLPRKGYKVGMDYSSSCLARTTTPVAYLTTSYIKDTFSEQYPLIYVNIRAQAEQFPSIIDVFVPDLSTVERAELVRHEYTVAGVGPDGLFHSQVAGDAAVIRGLARRTDFSSEYDPTNGTVSPGDIARTVCGTLW